MRKFLLFYFLLLPTLLLANIDIGQLVSFYELIPNKEKYNNSRITISGVILTTELHIGPGPLQRKTYLFPSIESTRYFLNHEAIELKLEFENNEGFFKFRDEMNLKIVEVTGEFKMTEFSGQDGQAFGELRKVTKLMPITPERFIRQ